jgi:hypothetical protein
MTAVGYGENYPVASNDTAAGRQLNRRVELVVSGEIIGIKIGAPPTGSSNMQLNPNAQGQMPTTSPTQQNPPQPPKQ